jgi:hypothetical protein
MSQIMKPNEECQRKNIFKLAEKKGIRLLDLIFMQEVALELLEIKWHLDK